jgi:hypothetical protein
MKAAEPRLYDEIVIMQVSYLTSALRAATHHQSQDDMGIVENI